ncbi:MAG: Vms1/Ankzf1 family peptidyl-tRNA hydrolase [Acidimicrobiales bacterium]
MTETAQSVDPGVTDSDLDPALVALARGAGPVVSAVLDTHAGGEQAGEPRLRQRWDALRRRLADEGAADEVLDRVGRAIDDARLDGPVVAAYCSPDLDEPVVITGPEEEGGDWAAWDRLPRLATVVRWHQATPPALLVAIDRTGAELISGGRASDPVLESVNDDDQYIRRIQPGGWSQRRYQQRAENSWRAIAGEVADRVTEHVKANGTRLVVVAGDVRAVQQLRDQLPERVARLVRLASGHPGAGSEGAMADDARRWYRTAVAEDTVAVVDHWKQELGRNGLAVTGIGPTLAALEQAAVATLLVHDDPADSRRRPVTSASADASAVDEVDPLVFEGDSPPRLVDGAIVSAWDSGAGVRVVPTVPEMTDGLGALLRFPLAR